MSLSVQTVKGELAAVLHGTTLGQIQNIDGVFNRAARQLMLDIDPQETKRVQQLSTPVFYQVYDYAPPTDLKGNKIIDLFPQVNRLPSDRFGQTYNQNFDLYKQITNIQDFTLVSDTGTKTLRINYINSSRSILLDSIGSITGNGTWAVSGTASNLLVNTSTVINGSNSLQFDVATGTGLLTNSTMTSVDLTNHQNLSTIFFDIYIYPASQITSLSLRFGSSSSDYWEKTGITTNYQGNSLVDGWNTIGIDWTDFTQVGSPSVSAIDYARIGVVASSTTYGVQVAQLWSKLGLLMNVEYYSKYLFSTSLGVWQETVTDDSNLINLDTESYNIFFYLLQLFCTQQVLGQVAPFDITLADAWYKNAVARYKRMYKSEVTHPQLPYYTVNKRHYNNFFGRTYP